MDAIGRHTARRRASARATWAVVGAAVLIGVAGTTSGANAAAGPPASTPTVARRLASVPDGALPSKPGLWLRHLHGGPLDMDQVERSEVVVLNDGNFAQIAQVHRANPAALVLVYKDLASTRTQYVVNGHDLKYLPTGVGYVEASAHPEWFLTDSSGHRLEWQPYPGSWQMDMGNAAYQQRWLADVRADLDESRTVLHGRGWDGVLIDNALTLADAYHSGVKSPEYPTDAAMQHSTLSMLTTVDAGLHADGFDVVANIGAGRLFPNLWPDWLPVLDGAMEEQFANFDPRPGTDFTWDWGPTGWRGEVAEAAAADAAGKRMLAQTQRADTDVNAERYGWASLLLAEGPGASFALLDDTPLIPEFGWDLGAPKGAYREVATGVYRRDFAEGVDIVNANHTASATVALGGTYLDAAGVARTTLTLPPMRAGVLRSPASVTAPSAPTLTSITSGNGWVNVAWNAPATDGGAPVSSYSVTLSTGETIDVPASAHAATLTVANGSATAARVAATNAVGLGFPSPVSSSVTPTGGSVDVTTTYDDAGSARLVKNAAYFGQSNVDAQRTSVGVIAYIVGVVGGPSTPQPSPPGSGSNSYTTSWSPNDQVALVAVARRFGLTPSEAQRFSVATVGYLLALGGN